VTGALAGIRVLDVGDRSGALAGRLLAGLGAEVVRVEPPGGDPMRGLPPAPGLFFEFHAAATRSVVLDLERAEDRATLARLAARADVLLDAGPPDRLARLGCEPARLRAASPTLVTVAITPFGPDGPWRDWRASDLIAQATGGMLYVNGWPDGPPLQALGPQAYHQAGVFAVIGVLAALAARERTGRGQHVDVSLQAAVTGALEHVPGLWHQSGQVPRRQGTLHWTRYFRVGRCRDGWVMHTTLGDWRALAAWLEADGMADNLTDPAWEDLNLRRDAAEHLFDVLDAWAARYTVGELVGSAQLRRIPYAAVRPPEALLDDPHLAARGFFVPVALPAGVPGAARAVAPGPPFRLEATPWRTGRAPRPGEHTAEVLRDWLAAGAGERRAPVGRPAADRPLAGVRVLDFTWVVAGPVATRILADLGAEVIKVERPDAVDFGDRRGGLSGTLLRGKRSVVLDLAQARGVELARRLAAVSDVVVDNFSARVMDNLGLDHASLRALRPDVISVRMTGFGLTGPARDHVSYGPTLQALAGYTLLMAEPGGPPAGFGYSYSDLAGGNLGALATLAALHHRRRTGRGQLVDLAQLEAVASLLGPLLAARALDGAASAPSGNAAQEEPGAPHGVYPARGDDRWVAIAVFDDRDWARFAAALGRPAWTADPGLATRAGRLARAAEIDRRVSEWTRTRSAEETAALLQAAGVAAGRVADARDLCAGDPQLAARGHFVRVPTPEGRTVSIDGPPYRLSETPAAVSGPGPLLGEHTDAVLSGVLDLGADEIAALRAARVVA
jgi:crotonobetainyl-CoA:carnitine CoA-transferase CaiB-like acyl-CoA transferase